MSPYIIHQFKKFCIKIIKKNPTTFDQIFMEMQFQAAKNELVRLNEKYQLEL